MSIPLPDEPSFEQLRNQARQLQRAVQAGEPEALAEIAELYPQPAADPAVAGSFRLTAAQLAGHRQLDPPQAPRRGGGALQPLPGPYQCR